MKARLRLQITTQPDDTTCGPTCLHAIYRYFGDDVPLKQVLQEVPSLKQGGTLGVMLANHALARGYRASIYTYNLMIFDPMWFGPGVDLPAKLAARRRATRSRKQRLAIDQYLEFTRRGGQIHLQDLRRGLLRQFLKRGIPILTGLNSTYLYRTMRVRGDNMIDDDIRGEVVGHFVVLCGYSQAQHTVTVADPYSENPYSRTHYYEAELDRVICSVLLGVMTYDANFLIIEPRGSLA
jgi:hypothetical protein